MPGSFCQTLALCAALSLPAATVAQEACTEDAMIVFDGSGSMAEMGYNGLDLPRILEAREAMRFALPRIAPVRRLGLVVYGPGQSDACSNVVVHMSPQPDAAGPILNVIDTIQPDGNTALTEAVKAAAEVLDYERKPGVVVLVTDGKETCGGQTCAVAAELAARGAGLTVHVIGFKVRDAYFDWKGAKDGPGATPAEAVARCLADLNGGEYFAAETVDELVRAMQQTLGCPIYSRLDPVRKP